MTATTTSTTRYNYIRISPRGFANETYIVKCADKAQAQRALDIINDDVNAWAERVPASDPQVRAEAKDRDCLDPETEQYYDGIPVLAEHHVRKHRPILLHNDGSRSYGGGEL